MNKYKLYVLFELYFLSQTSQVLGSMVWVFLCFLSDSLFFKDLGQIPHMNASLAVSPAPSPLSSSCIKLDTRCLQSLESLAFWTTSGESMMRRTEEGETSFQLWRKITLSLSKHGFKNLTRSPLPFLCMYINCYFERHLHTSVWPH